MPFETDGFFSKEIEDFRRHVRTTEPFKAWLDYATTLVQLGFEILAPLETPLGDERLMYLNTAFVRVHQGLQAVLLLAERGVIGDARVIIRSGVEFAIAINALARAVSGRVELVGGRSSQRTENVLLEARRIGGGAGWGLCQGICASGWFWRFTRKA